MPETFTVAGRMLHEEIDGMETQQGKTPKNMEMIKRALGNPLAPGELGVLMAGAGVGKTACLTHIALEQLLNGKAVLHVCIDDSPEKAKVWYHELLKNILSEEQGESLAGVQLRIEPLRFIQSYLQQVFTPEKLSENLSTLRSSADFQPVMIVVDGLDFNALDRKIIEQMKSIAQENGLSIWLSARTPQHISQVNSHGIPYPCHQMDDLFASIILLEPSSKSIQVKVLKHGQDYQPSLPRLSLNAQTYLLNGD